MLQFFDDYRTYIEPLEPLEKRFSYYISIKTAVFQVVKKIYYRKAVFVMMGFYELEPHFANVKSFYGKARIEREGDDIRLISYTTHVAGVKNGKPYINGFYSATTSRHIKEFFLQMGYSVTTRKDIEALCA